MDTIVINTSDDSDINIVLETVPTLISRKKHVKRRLKRKVMQSGRDGVVILCRNKRCRYSQIYRDTSFKKPDLQVKNVQEARIVPCCLRKVCESSNIRLIQKRHGKKIRKCHVHKREDSPLNSEFIYEDISSESLESDIEVDKLIEATRKRMKKQFHERVTPKLRPLTPQNENCSESTFDINSVHSLDTVILEKVEIPIVMDSYTSYISPVRLESIKIENNNNNVTKFDNNNPDIKCADGPALRSDMKTNILGSDFKMDTIKQELIY